jgi:hypothetical protein
MSLLPPSTGERGPPTEIKLSDASFARLDMLAPIYPPLRDLRLSGHVIHTGRSSMEVAVQLVALGDGGVEETLMLGKGVGKNVKFAPPRTRIY